MGKYNILYLNINSLRENLEELEFISKERPGIFFIVLTGIKISQQQNATFNIHNYRAHFNNRGDGKAGVALYVHQSMISTEIINNYTENVHQLAVQIHSLGIKLGVIYTESETKKEIALQMYNEMIEKHRNLILFADIDIDLMDRYNSHTGQYFRDTSNRNFVILNNKTFGTKMVRSHINRSESLVDHIVTDLKSFDYTVSLSDVVFSDHKQIMLGFNDHSPQHIKFYTAPKKFAQREIDTEKYSFLLARANINTNNFNDFIEILFSIRNQSWKMVFKDNTLDSMHPWHNQEISDLIHKRNDYFKLLQDEPQSRYLQAQFNELMHQVSTLFTSLRSKCNGQRINECENDPKKMKKIISQIIENKNAEDERITAIRAANGEILTIPKQIANCFNGYFKRTRFELYNNIPKNALEFFDTLERNKFQLILRLTTREEIAQKISQMKVTTHRNEIITSKLLKENSARLVPTLTASINDCLMTGKFPYELKIARIIPKFKKSEKERLSPANYRPIHVLQSLSKLIEMIIYDRIVEFCMKRNIFHKHQFGFLKKSGAAGAVATMLDYVRANINENTFGVCVFMDLKTAVDTIPHTNLIEKLEKIGIRGSFLDLIKDFLKNRKQFVDINGKYSNTYDCNTIGIPQGSIVGSLFVILYVNDLFNLPFIGKIVLYCDDITLVYVSGDSKRLEEHINYDLQLLNNWLNYNKLTINMEKIKYMVMSENRKFFNVSLKLTVNDQDIERVRTQKYLGIRIQHNFKWNQEISHVARSIDGISGSIKRLGDEISLQARKDMYYSMVLKHFSPLIHIFSALPLGYDNRMIDWKTLQRSQDKFIRRLFGRDSDGQIATDAMYKNNQIMKVKQLIRLDSALFHRKRAIDFSKFGRNVDANNSALDLAHTHPNTVQFACAQFYNYLDTSITGIEQYDAFKKAVKRFILSNDE